MQEIKELLRRFHIVVYTGSQINDIILMELELDDLYHEKLIEQEDYLRLKAVLIKELQKVQKRYN